MKDNIAVLNSLTLPAGSTTGERIVLDGVNGEIRIYDANDNLVILIDGEGGFHAYDTAAHLIVQVDDNGIRIRNISGILLVQVDSSGFRVFDLTGQVLFHMSATGMLVYDSTGHVLFSLGNFGLWVYDVDGNVRTFIGDSGESGGYSGITLKTANVDETAGGVINLHNIPGFPTTVNRLILTPGEIGSRGGLELALQSAALDDGAPAMIQANALTLDAVGNMQPIIDFCGGTVASGHQPPKLVVHDLWYGTRNGWGYPPTEVSPAPRGKVDKATSAGPIVLSTTAGTYTDTIVGNTFTPINGHRYKIIYWNAGGNLLIAGSGFATTDTWDYKFQVSVGGGAYVDVMAGIQLCRLQVAAATRQPLMAHINDYVAASASTLRFKLVARKSSGVATVTSQIEGTNHLLVEDIAT